MSKPDTPDSLITANVASVEADSALASTHAADAGVSQPRDDAASDLTSSGLGALLRDVARTPGAPPDAVPAFSLGPFEIRHPIGRGGMGQVFEACHVASGASVAIKVISSEAGGDDRFREAFLSEVRAVAGLSHPGIIRVLDMGAIDAAAARASQGMLRVGEPYLAMALFPGGGLGRADYPRDWSSLRALLLAVLDALAHAHARSVIHRDLKPGNLLVDRTGGHAASARQARVVLTDFGLAHALDEAAENRLKGVLSSHSELTEAAAGTPDFMAPEQILGHWRDQGPWTDLYALGCLGYLLASGHPPFAELAVAERLRAHVGQSVPPLQAQFEVPPGLAAWVASLMAKSRGDRFQRAADAAQALLTLPVDDPQGPRFFALVAPQPASSARLPTSWRRPDVPRPPVELAGAGLGLYGLRATPMVGREDERDVLWEALAQVGETKRAAVVAISGSAGVGKTRLSRWLAQRAHEVGAAEVIHATHERHSGPRHGLAAAMCRALRCQGLSAATLRTRLGVLLSGSAWDDPVQLDALCAVLGLAASPAGTNHSPTAAVPDQAHPLMRRLLGWMARERPVILWVDDVQWGADTLAFARDLLLTQERQPAAILLLLTVQDEALAEQVATQTAWQRVLETPGCIRLALTPLAAADQALLIRRLANLDSALAAQVEARTQGNPLFAVQLLRDWIEQGWLTPTPSGFGLEAGVVPRLPDGLHDVWASRIERLCRELAEPLAVPALTVRASLELAAVLGQNVDTEEWLAACREAGIALAIEMLEALLKSQLAVAHEAKRWSFAQGMLRESLLRMADQAGRLSTLHRVAAHVVGRPAGAGTLGLAERLARHWVAGGEPEAALPLFLAAAKERLATGEIPAALELLDQREVACRDLGLGSDDQASLEGRILRARAENLLGYQDRALAQLDEIIDAARTRGYSALLGPALCQRGHALGHRGDLAGAARCYQEALETAQRDDDVRGRADALHGLGEAARQQGMLDQAREHTQQAWQLYNDLGDLRATAASLRGLGLIAARAGRIDEAMGHYQGALERFQEMGHLKGVAACLNDLAEGLRHRGDGAAAEAAYRRARELHLAIGSAGAVVPTVNLGLALLAQKRYADAEEPLTWAATELERLGWKGNLAEVHAALLACAAGGRRWERFDEHLERTAAFLGVTGAGIPDVAQNAELAAQLARGESQAERAVQAYRLAVEQWTRLGRDADRARAEEGLALAEGAGA